jgi:hypothetical protein
MQPQQRAEIVGVMNDTKWEELRAAMYDLGRLHPQFRIKDRDREAPWSWDGEWFYHFRLRDYRAIEYVDLEVRSQEQRDAVRSRLRAIHVPGFETDEGFRVCGWIERGVFVDYIQ